MKRLICIICIPLLVCIMLPVMVFASDDESDLPINTQGIKEREYKQSALTDAYGADIFTVESMEMQSLIKSLQEHERKVYLDSLLINEFAVASSIDTVNERVNEKGLFSKPHTHSTYEALPPQDNKEQTLLWIIIFVALAVISFFAALALQQKKRRKGNVHNNYYKNPRASL